MSNTFMVSDHHFAHRNILTFKNEDGSNLRTFDSCEEMDETMINNHNSVVGSNDTVYFLGDVCFGATRFHDIMPSLNGTKVLIKGNHDSLKMSAYVKYFKDVRSCHMLDRIHLSHIPIHPGSLCRWRGNVHGHLHSGTVKKQLFSLENGSPTWTEIDDHRYFNVSVEKINYTPVAFEVINKHFKDNGL